MVFFGVVAGLIRPKHPAACPVVVALIWATLSNALTDIADNIRANSSSFDAGEDEGASSFKQVAAAGASLLNL